MTLSWDLPSSIGNRESTRKLGNQQTKADSYISWIEWHLTSFYFFPPRIINTSMGVYMEEGYCFLPDSVLCITWLLVSDSQVQ